MSQEYQVINPTTGQELSRAVFMSPHQAEQQVEQSQEAFQTWKKTTFAERARLMKKVAQLMRQDKQRLGLLMTDEMGKPIREARAEVEKAAWCAEHYAEHAQAYLAPQAIESDASYSGVQHLPLGVILGILPWNAPFWLAFRFCAPALMAGNVCLMKHDHHVPATAQAIAELFVKAGFPVGVMSNLPLETAHVAAIIEHPYVQAVSYTGSEGGGAQVASLAAKHIKPSVLELGGSDPAIVLADADLEAAVETLALSRLINAGQSCIAAKRLLVEAPVYDVFVARLLAKLKTLKMGDPRQEETDIGPIARQDLQLELQRQVSQSIAEGGRCLLGGQIDSAQSGFFFPVTLLVDMENTMTACREETFGPIAVVEKVASAEEAIGIANDSPYGLASSIWTSTERGLALAPLIEAGQVAINGLVKTDPRLPSGGIKRSGFGRELGPHGIMEFVNVQQIWVK